MSELEETLCRIAQQEPSVSYEVILDWCREYPALREPLVRFFVRWTVLGEVPTINEFAREERIANQILHHMEKYEWEPTEGGVDSR